MVCAVSWFVWMGWTDGKEGEIFYTPIFFFPVFFVRQSIRQSVRVIHPFLPDLTYLRHSSSIHSPSFSRTQPKRSFDAVPVSFCPVFTLLCLCLPFSSSISPYTHTRQVASGRQPCLLFPCFSHLVSDSICWTGLQPLEEGKEGGSKGGRKPLLLAGWLRGLSTRCLYFN